MRIGAAQIDITPSPGIELCGFALRQQPSIGLLDRLYAKCLYLENETHRLLWIHCDLIGLDRGFVKHFRRWSSEKWGLDPHQVLLSATHTHSGPAPILLAGAGEQDAHYVSALQGWFDEAARSAMSVMEACELVWGTGSLNLAIDRRHRPSAHVDPQLMAMGWRAQDGHYVAAVMNYAMHPVSLGHENRLISADFCGAAAMKLASLLPGDPIVLCTNGACGNLNPPALNVPPGQMRQWGEQIGDLAAECLGSADPTPDADFQSSLKVVNLPAQETTVEQIQMHAKRFYMPQQQIDSSSRQSRQVLDTAARNWERNRIADLKSGHSTDIEAELFCLSFGGLIFVGVNAEVFSQFTDLLRLGAGRTVCTLGYADGVFGYLPTRQAYEEGGYEPDVAMFYYDVFRPHAGSLEELAFTAESMMEAKS
jgi:hypothetical protein